MVPRPPVIALRRRASLCTFDESLVPFYLIQATWDVGRSISSPKPDILDAVLDFILKVTPQAAIRPS